MNGAFKTASILGGRAVLGIEINNDYDLEKLVSKRTALLDCKSACRTNLSSRPK